ncbi:MAG TPA: hypothetical protein VGL91_13550 [Acidobacteriota bacterium]
MDDKVIATNLSALRQKYGSGADKIKAAVRKLIVSDKKRGLRTRLVALDDAAVMKKLKAPVVTKAADPKQNKRAIDALFRALLPDYLLLLGATDVIPHQDMKNPVYGGEDLDALAYGDLPYACEAPYSQRPQDFIGPTRVVGRLPDLTGGNDPAYLLGILETATRWKMFSQRDYAGCLAISTYEWRGSTEMSLQKVFGASADLQLSPPRGPRWNKLFLARHCHFINCHGAPADFHFYGQRGKNYPVSHDASYIEGKIIEGTVAAVECCYGAELYDPSLLKKTHQAGMCNTYLANKAYGFFGSTTIAYGPSDGNGSADLICQFFLRHVLAGASLGRAVLEARQEFAQSAPELDPMDIKTIAQFNLIGDPSIHPVPVPAPQSVAIKSKSTKGLPPEATRQAAGRADRRRQLAARGLWISDNQPVARRSARMKPSRPIHSTLKKMVGKARLKRPRFLSFSIRSKSTPKQVREKLAKMTKMPVPTAFHIVVARKAEKRAPILQLVALVAKEAGGKIVSIRELHSR